MRKNARKANFANDARLADSFRQSHFPSRIFCSHFPMPFLSLFRRYLWRARAHTGESFLSSFFFLRVPWSLLCRHAHPLLKFSFRPLPNSRFATYRRWRTGQYRFERYPPAFCNIEPACRFSLVCMAAGEWINAATDGGRGFQFARIERT